MEILLFKIPLEKILSKRKVISNNNILIFLENNSPVYRKDLDGGVEEYNPADIKLLKKELAVYFIL